MIPLHALLIEDSEDDAIILLRELKQAGYDVTSLRVDTGKDLLSALQDKTWDVIFCDYTMPGGFNAFTALETIKTLKRETPFIIVSGTIGEERAVAAMKAGAQDYFIKGDIKRLIPALQRELKEAKNRAESIRTEQERARLTSVIEATSDLVGVSDNQRRRLYLNKAGRQMLGIGADEDITSLLVDDVYPEWLKDPMFNEAIPTAIREGIWKGESALLSRDGHEIPVSQVIIAHKSPDGSVQYLSTIARDITQSKKMENDLAETNRKLEKALGELRQAQKQMVREERLLAFQQMAASIVHDVNNLLTPITGFTELFLSKPDLLNNPKRVRLHLEMVNIAGRDAANIIRRLRLFYQVPGDTAARIHLDLNMLVRQAIKFTEPLWKSQAEVNGVTIKVETDLSDIPLVNGDEVELREVITNLILNAVDAMQDGGVLNLHTYIQSKYVVLVLNDTGVGMPPDVLQRCFEPFFTTKGTKGTGLGLAIAYGVIHRHGGDISIESQVGKGTTVTIHLPVARDTKPEVQQPTEAPSRPLNIMLVDDDAAALQTGMAYLVSEGHTVKGVSSGYEALDILTSGKFDVVITDLAMPGMDGLKLAESVQQIAPHTPVIVLSGFADQLEAMGQKPKNVEIILNKPISLNDLRRALRQVTF